MSKRFFAFAYVLFGALSWAGPLPAPAWAQSASLGGGQPVEVFADDGIEWRQNQQIFVANGNARAISGDMVLYADQLIAHYRSDQGQSSRVYRLEALGNVKIATPGETAFGDRGIYEIDSGVMVLTGSALKFTTPTDEVTARDSLEYWIDKQTAVARGDALVVTQGRRLRADVLSALFAKETGGPNAGKTAVNRVNAFGNVTAVTASEVVQADKGVYEVKSGMVYLTGSVKMTRGENQLNGCRADVNLINGVSKLLACPDGQGNGRVRGLLAP